MCDAGFTGMHDIEEVKMAKSSVAFEALAPGLWRRPGLTCLVDTNGRLTTYDETRPIILPERLHGECGLQSTLDHFHGEA